MRTAILLGFATLAKANGLDLSESNAEFLSWVIAVMIGMDIVDFVLNFIYKK